MLVDIIHLFKNSSLGSSVAVKGVTTEVTMFEYLLESNPSLIKATASLFFTWECDTEPFERKTLFYLLLHE